MGVLVTRPEPGLSHTMQALAARGLQPIACPMLRIRRRAPLLPDVAGLDAILLTSGQAVAPLADAAVRQPGLRRVPLFAVGDATEARAREAGFSHTRSATGDAAALASLVRTAVPPPATLLLATAAGQGQALAASLRATGYRLHRRIVYEALPALSLSPEAQTALREGRVTAVLFFSAETARNFARLCPVELRLSLRCVEALTLSAVVAQCLAPLPWQSVRIARHPDAASLLSLLRSPS